jgi:hypothetical protein
MEEMMLRLGDLGHRERDTREEGELLLKEVTFGGDVIEPQSVYSKG